MIIRYIFSDSLSYTQKQGLPSFPVATKGSSLTTEVDLGF